MAISVSGVTIDCRDPRGLAEFWTEALGYQVDQDYGGEYLTLAPPGGGERVALQRVPEEKVVKNRVHLDLAADDRSAEVARLVSLGARAVAEHTVPHFSWTVLQDPEGNEFCVGSPH